MSAPTSITCPRCGTTSPHPVDVREGYCSTCRAFTSPPLAQRRTMSDAELEALNASTGFSMPRIKAALSRRAQGKRGA